MPEKYFVDESSDGQIKIADDIISKIALEAATKVEGVSKDSKNKNIFKNMTDPHPATKFARAQTDELRGEIDLYLAIDYGQNIVDVAGQVQTKVREAVQTMTDVEITEVNVHVTGLAMTENNKEIFKK